MDVLRFKPNWLFDKMKEMYYFQIKAQKYASRDNRIKKW